MGQEETLERLKKTRRDNEDAYLKAKAFLDGFRARGQLSQKDSEFLSLMEFANLISCSLSRVSPLSAGIP